MPIVTYHLVAGRYDDAAVGELLTRSCELFAEVLDSPLERVRAFADEVRPQLSVVGGRLVSDGAPPAPFFEFILLEGRPVDQAQRLLRGFTDLVVECLGAERSLVRGGITYVRPDSWAIGGEPAAALRKTEIDARAAAFDGG